MDESTDAMMAHYRDVLRHHPGTVESLPEVEKAVARGAMEGASVYDIANDQRISVGAVWTLLEGLAASLEGDLPEHPTETGGLGSDTDPGVTGGYGETGFGSLGLEPPVPDPEGPRERR